MTVADYLVPPRSWADIDAMGVNIRDRFGLSREPRFPILEFLEEVLDYRLAITEFRVGDHVEMGMAEGFTHPSGDFVMLRDDVYEAGIAGQGRARFTAAHELGHLVMHTNMPLARATADAKPYRLAEPQANQFASAILMPRSFFSAGDTPDSVAERHGVSRESARLRLTYFERNP